MVHFKKKTFFGNRYSLQKLIEFRDLIERYFALDSNSDHKEITNLRAKINNLIQIIDEIISEANVSTYVLGFPGEGYVPELGPSVGEEVPVLNYKSPEEYEK